MNKDAAHECDVDVVEDDGDEDLVSFNVVSSKRNRCLSWPQIWVLLVAAGTKRLTKAHYNSVRRLIKHVADEVALPSFNTFTSVIRKGLLAYNCVQAVSADIPVDDSIAGTKAFQEYRRIRYVPISEYAKADFRNPVFLRETKKASFGYLSSRSPHPETSCSADYQPLVSSREFFFQPHHIITDTKAEVEYAECGDEIRLDLFRYHEIPTPVKQAFVVPSSGRTTTFSGIITCVHNFTGTGGNQQRVSSALESGAFEVDVAIERFLSTLELEEIHTNTDHNVPDMESSSDSGDEAEAEIRKMHRRPSISSGKRRTNQRDTIWQPKELPTLRPSDTICILRPSNSEVETASTHPSSTIRLVVIFRFWSLPSESQKFCAWIPSTSVLTTKNRGIDIANNIFARIDMDTQSSSCNWRLSGISSVVLSRRHAGPRLLDKYTPVSSVGKLEDGSAYGIYRGIIYWDGFQMFQGRTASAEGVYFKCLNTETSSRGSPDAIRILTLLPPGSKTDDALQLLCLDIVHGTCRGFKVTDAEGVTRTIFLDIVGFFGDTPALNSTIDVRGHNATSCCHLCSYIRGDKNLTKARYTALTYGSQSTSSIRLDWKHSAVRSNSSCADLLQRLGMKSNWNNLEKGIQSIKRGLEFNSHLIPKTNQGVRVVPAVLDSFQATLVSPDHLLTAVVRDAINVIYNSLPTKEMRSKLERSLHILLTLSNALKQKELFHKKKHVLHSMPLSQLYDLASIFPIALSFTTKGTRYTDTPRVNAGRKLCRLICNLVARFWLRTTTKSTIAHNKVVVRKITDEYLRTVTEFCNFNSPSCPDRNYANLCLKYLDKPNLHRLRELAYNVLSKFDHIGWVSELAMERAHQYMKRTLRQSDNREVHLAAMTDAIMDDWKMRLFGILTDEITPDDLKIRALVPLLLKTSVCNSGCDEYLLTEIRTVLDRKSFLVSELKEQTKLSRSYRTQEQKTFQWKRHKSSLPLKHQSHALIDKEIDELLQKHFYPEYTNKKIVKVTSVLFRKRTTIPYSLLNRGSAVEINENNDHLDVFEHITNCSSGISTSRTAYFILGFFYVSNSSLDSANLYAIVIQLYPIRDSLSTYIPNVKCRLTSRVRFLKMSADIEFPLLVLHNPQFYFEGNKLNNFTPNRGHESDIFLLLNLSSGYPPRNG